MTINNHAKDQGALPLDKRPLGLYLHIPFCVRKCLYCDFLSFPAAEPSFRKAYLRALSKEIQYLGKLYNNTYYVDTLFVGGGTPSLLSPLEMSDLFEAVSGSFFVSKDVEITMEANPGTLAKEKLNACLQAGVNRLSLGVQSLDNSLLTLLGRVHTAREARESVVLARRAGFSNISCDLMFGIPQQSLESWKRTLAELLALEPEHISFYSLQLEEGTPLQELVSRGRLALPEADLDRRMYRDAIEILEDRGYLHYEISNSARPGFESRHNMKYWTMADYLGAGLSAHSYLMEGEGKVFEGARRFYNTSDPVRYLKMAETGFAPEETETSTRRGDIGEFIFTGLRRRQGISLSAFQQRYGESLAALFSREIKKNRDAGFLEMDEEAGTLRLTLSGIDVSNRVMSDFI